MEITNEKIIDFFKYNKHLNPNLFFEQCIEFYEKVFNTLKLENISVDNHTKIMLDIFDNIKKIQTDIIHSDKSEFIQKTLNEIGEKIILQTNNSQNIDNIQKSFVEFSKNNDTLVKSFFHEKSGLCVCPPGMPVCTCGKIRQVHVLTKKSIKPDESEIRRNPRARSARLRACEKIHT